MSPLAYFNEEGISNLKGGIFANTNLMILTDITLIFRNIGVLSYETMSFYSRGTLCRGIVSGMPSSRVIILINLNNTHPPGFLLIVY